MSYVFNVFLSGAQSVASWIRDHIELGTAGEWVGGIGTAAAGYVAFLSLRRVREQHEKDQAARAVDEAKREAEQRHRFEVELLRELLATAVDPRGHPGYITDQQFSLYLMLPPGTLPFWRDFLEVISQASAKGELPLALYVEVDGLPKPVVHPVIQGLWSRHGVAHMRTVEDTLMWLLRRDILRALAPRTGRDSAEVDVQIEELYGQPVKKPGEVEDPAETISALRTSTPMPLTE